MGENMIIEDYEVNGLESASRAIGFSYGKELEDDEKRLKLAKVLVKRGLNSGESNFLTGITVDLTVNASIKWWQQAERYHWFQIVMSQSVMHSVATGDWEFTSDTPKDVISLFNENVDRYKNKEISKVSLIYSVPVGLKEKARVTTNYLQLLTMYHQRKNHALPEWKEFCHIVEEMPMMKEFL
nr:MAG TPA: Thymidylate synthase complementing protein [Caudoviricetes sp.]